MLQPDTTIVQMIFNPINLLSVPYNDKNKNNVKNICKFIIKKTTELSDLHKYSVLSI